MSQMKPYCFKCGAALDPDAIYCPECGRLQRSMVVRTGDPSVPSAPKAPSVLPPVEFYPGRETQPAPQEEQYADQSHSHPDAAWQHPDQVDPYAQQRQAEQGWHGEEQPDAHAAQSHEAWAPEAGTQQFPPQAGDQVYAQQDYQEQDYQHDSSWSQPGHDPYQQGQTEYDYSRSDEHAYSQPDSVYGQPEPAPSAEPEAARETWRQQPPPEPAPDTWSQPPPPELAPEAWRQQPPEEPAPAPETWRRQPPPPPLEPTSAPAARAAPVYSSSAPIPTGSLEPYPVDPPDPYAPASSSSYYRPSSSPYALTPYDAGAASSSKPPPNLLRLVAIGGAVLLGLFLVGFGVGVLRGGSSDTAAPSAAAPQVSLQPTTAPTTQPTAAPTIAATATATATANQGVTGSARFVRVSSSIPGRCSTSQGCPVQVVLKNNGGSGSGTVTVTLTDSSNSQIATFTGQIPVTDAGATVTVNGYATGDRLGSYINSGGIVSISSVDVKSGG